MFILPKPYQSYHFSQIRRIIYNMTMNHSTTERSAHNVVCSRIKNSDTTCVTIFGCVTKFSTSQNHQIIAPTCFSFLTGYQKMPSHITYIVLVHTSKAISIISLCPNSTDISESTIIGINQIIHCRK